MNQEIEQEINQEILDTAQRLFNQVEKELNTPATRKLYVNGSRDLAIKVNTDPLIEAIALKIIEKNALQQCTFDEEELDFLKEELFFHTDLFYTVVTTVIELAAIRRTDISASTPFLDLFSVMEILMASVRDVAELDNLRNVLRDMADAYPEKPELQRRIALLVPEMASQKDIYIIAPPKRIDEYQDNDVLASLDPNENITDTEVAGLPAGVAISQSKGTLTVEDASLLEMGIYPIIITTTDLENGTTVNTVSLPIGINGHAVYDVRAAKQFTKYNNDDILATASDPDGEIISAKLVAEPGSNLPLMPAGVSLNAVNGTIKVAEKQFLIPGSFPLSILTKDIHGFESLNRIVLVFKEDHEAAYDVKAPNEISDYRNNQVLATVSDIDGGVVMAAVNGLPAGVGLDPLTGTISVADHAALQSGKYKFNILANYSSGYQKVCTVDLVIGNGSLPVQYLVAASKKIHNYTNGFVLASVNLNGQTISSATLLSGELPSGTSLNNLTGEITVSDSTALKSGSYGLTILVKPTVSDAQVHAVELFLEPDYKAVYRVSYGKDVNDYAFGEVVAEVIDCDGITFAEIVEGTLPPGTSFNEDTGIITVSDVTALVAGKYVLKIATEDAEKGTTESRIAIFFGGFDNEAVYTFADPKAVDGYKIGDIIASVTDVDLGVVKASLSKGALPLGTALNLENGNVFINDPTKLLPGTFDHIFVKTTDGVGRTTESELTLTFLSDLQISYLLLPAKVVTAYDEDEELVQIISDSPDDVKSAVLSSGGLPPGTKLNSQTGVVSVYDTAFLKAGDYPVSIIVTDKNGGQTTLSFIIVLLADQPAVWWVIQPTSIDLLTNGTILAYPTDPNGAIVSAVPSSLKFPPGIVLNPLSGVVTVGNVALLKAGLIRVGVKTTDIVGGITNALIAITILNSDKEAIYKVEPAKNLDAYIVNDILASATDPNGPITNAVVTNGAIPPGSILVSDGTIKVSDLSLFDAGIFTVEIKTTDSTGQTTDSALVIEILQDNEAQYVVAQPMNIDTVTNGLLIAAVTDVDAAIVSATLIAGAIPSGMLLYENMIMTAGTTRSVGDIVVTNALQVVPGVYSGIQLLTLDDTGGKTQFNLTITINPDNDAVYSVAPARDLHSYRNADILAFPADPDGAIIAASLVSGSLHSGVGLSTSTGIISVVSRTTMVGGIQNPGIETEDVTGGITSQILDVSVKPLPNRTNRQLYRLFIRRFRERLDELEVLFADRLDSSFTENRAFLDSAKAVADIVLSDLDTPSIEQNYWNGNKDAFIKTNFLAISDPVKDGILNSIAIITGGGTPTEIADATRDLSLRAALYNEIFVSMLDLTAYRMKDISASPVSDVQTMFDELDLQLNDVRALSAVTFVIENITVIKDGISLAHPRLINRLTDLLT